MSIYVAINHKTVYTYDRLINLSPHIFRLRPAPHCRTPIQGYSLRIRPEEHFINWQQDPFGNYQARVVFPKQTKELSIEVDVVADMTPINPFDFFVDESAEHYPFTYNEQDAKDLAPYLNIDEKGPRLLAWLQSVDRSHTPINDFLVALNQKLYCDIEYSVRMDPGVQTCEKTLEKALGSCRDSGWLLVQILRHLGLAARFVSGYLVQLTADQEALDGPSGPLADFTDLHAWAEVYVPGAGWLGLDPTSGLFAGEGHIPLACTPSPQSAAPVTGYTDECEATFDFDNSVQRIFEDPRVTKPYTTQQWEAINQLGEQVDEELFTHDVRLTMGGEPTFVSIDDMEGAEWNFAADGPHKRALAHTLIQRLHNAFGRGGILHFGQGKWYPGEQLPRWKLAAYWRTDGLPMWQDPSLFDQAGVESTTSEQSAKVRVPEDAQRFTKVLAEKLGLSGNFVIPAFEDVFYFLWEESNVPDNLNPLEKNLDDPLERQQLAHLLEKGLNNPTGYILPLAWNFTHGPFASQSWMSSGWPTRRSQLFLLPGNSPMGLRLPLENLPWQEEAERSVPYERSPFEPMKPLPDYANSQAFLEQSPLGKAKTAPAIAEQALEKAQTQTKPQTDPIAKGSDKNGHQAERLPEDKPKRKVTKEIREVVRTALCAEVRGGQLYIFMPPLVYLEHYLQLLNAIELTASELAMPIILEGYEPPSDHRLQKLLVTPDPGVVEVNIHPVGDWQTLVANTETLYEEARLSRLGTEKFLIDGRHTGTGGGNHVTLGGPSAPDSPFLRRPDLLRSLITYWQHHPGLSYLFSSMFIGPTSQAPRVDEGRDDRLYELEIAFSQIPARGQPSPPWLVDRVLRNLLVDLTGNTHRAEFCIDKLYSPDSASGRQGLLELRAFDMPPHARMSLVQLLLVRTLVARFWQEPYYKPLVRWGTQLHDRFLLPHYVEEDLQDVVTDLNEVGYPFDLAWLDPFHEFRFPRYGTANVQGMEVEVRMAIEPWHVLGEEVSSQGTARYVDSSAERIQVRVNGLTDSRHILTCNGRQVPLRNTGTHGEYVAGIRYQAWQPPSALHPTMPVQAPLVIDLVDSWSNRAIGGCTYHVVHPGGRGYEDIPVNDNVAEARRISRFWGYGHTPNQMQLGPRIDWRTTPPPVYRNVTDGGGGTGPTVVPPLKINPEFPETLDLRLG
ncbi:MAG: transglutaminase family protein [Chloroflexota bacterium]